MNRSICVPATRNTECQHAKPAPQNFRKLTAKIFLRPFSQSGYTPFFHETTFFGLLLNLIQFVSIRNSLTHIETYTERSQHHPAVAVNAQRITHSRIHLEKDSIRLWKYANIHRSASRTFALTVPFFSFINVSLKFSAQRHFTKIPFSLSLSIFWCVRDLTISDPIQHGILRTKHFKILLLNNVCI